MNNTPSASESEERKVEEEFYITPQRDKVLRGIRVRVSDVRERKNMTSSNDIEELSFSFEEATKWRQLALHALSDLDVLGVPIDKIIGVNEEVLEEVQKYQRDQTSYS